MRKAGIAVLVLIATTIAGCAPEPLALGSVSDSRLRLDGAYAYVNRDRSCGSGMMYATFYLYGNGSMLYAGSICGESLDSYLNYVAKSNSPGSMTSWASLTIAKDSLCFEMYSPPSFPAKARSTIYYGRVTSDTSFVVTRSVYRRTGFARPADATYTFVKPGKKPDSVNTFFSSTPKNKN